MTGERPHGCIYCGGSGPYTDEHVIPAGLGAGDEWLLKDLVCAHCNSAFSAFEGRVLRRGDVGLGRLAMQPAGRHRGKKTRSPTFEAVAAKLVREDGETVEIALGHGLVPEILPYIALDKDRLEGGGTDREKVAAFLERLEALLRERVTLVFGRASSASKHRAVALALGAGGYAPGAAAELDKPTIDMIWIEPHPDQIPGPRTTILQRPQGSVVIQVAAGDVLVAASLLTHVRANLASLAKALEGTSAGIDIPQPGIHLLATPPADADVTRLLAKIGINLLAHDRGPVIARDRSFDAVCRFVRLGEPAPRSALWPDDNPFSAIMQAQFAKQHWMMLAPIPRPDLPSKALALAFISSLYGGGARMVELGDSVPESLGHAHILIAVDYACRRIERFTIAEVLSRARRSLAVAPQTSATRPSAAAGWGS